MTTIDGELRTQIDPAEVQSMGKVISPVRYNIQDSYEYGLNRFMRQIKFIVIGGAVGVATGLLVGVAYASRLAEFTAPNVPLAAASSITVAGLVLGVVGGFIAEQITASRMVPEK